LLLAGVRPLLAQDPAAEKRAFAAAARAFEDGIYDRAEREFGEFVQKFPQAAQVPEAILFQARAALKLQKLHGAVDLLATNAGRAGPLADQYRYFEAEAHLQNSNYLAAADTFALLAREFTNSVRLLEASYGEALARFHLKDRQRVIDLLQRPDGTFQQAAKRRANDELAVRGHLLLAEALFAQKEFKAVEQALAGLSERDLVPEFKWRRQYLLCRAQVADERWAEALPCATNLLALAAATGQRALLAESVALHAGILESLKQFDAAIQAYEQNLGDDVPPEFSRQALVQIVELTLAQERFAEAARRLEAFLARRPGDAGSDVALLTLGEVHLRLHAAGADTNRPPAVTNALVAATNHLPTALAQFDRLIASFTNSPLLGKAHLNRGWCLWLDGKTAESVAAFRTAVEKLPHSEEQAVARFKLADGLFLQKDFTNALACYRSVVTAFDGLPRVQHTLLDQALYQLLRASLHVGDLSTATDAMKKILHWFPDSSYRDRSLLLVGQSYTLAGKPAEARGLYAELARRIPTSTLLPEVELAGARTYVQEGDWASAIGKYEEWIGRYGTNELRALAEFNRAWATYQAGHQTNALALFTNFVARFPAHELAAQAQFWVGTYHYERKDFVNAEKSFQDKALLQNTNFAYQARMMAGRAAFARQGWKDARDHFTALVNDSPTAEAFFALGDTITRGDADPARPLQKFEEARVAFAKIPQLYPDSPLAPAAWGRIGDCYFQLAAQDPRQYDNATNAFWKAITAPGAEVKVRWQAEMGLAQVLERLVQSRPAPENSALLKAAFDHCYNIVSGKSLRDGESPDPFWLKEAGLTAARLAEEQKQWAVAANVYERLRSVLPSLAPLLERRMEKIREQSRPEKN
jgi:TolA-binding protein